MHQYLGIRMFLLELQNLLQREFLMHMACPVPQHHVPARDAVDIAAQVLVGTKDDGSVLWEALHYLAGIAAGHHHIGHGLGGSCGVDIAYHRVAGMLLDEGGKLVGRTAVGQRTARVQVGHQHHLVGTENLCRLAHEVHATEHDDVGICLGGLLGQCQRVAHKVGHVLHHAFRVVVCHDDGVLLGTQSAYSLFQVGSLRDTGRCISFFFPIVFYHSCRHFFLLLYIFLFSI